MDEISFREKNHSFADVQSMLKERVKELNCIYRITELIEMKTSLQDIFKGIPEIIPPSWQYPEHTCAQLSIGESTYETDHFSSSSWYQTGEIFVNNEVVGTLIVYYMKEFPKNFEGPFLKEERLLLNTICKRLGRVIERFSVKEELQNANSLMMIQNKTLDAKNIALKELLNQIEIEKKQIENNIEKNIESFILPLIDQIDFSNSMDIKDILVESLLEMTSSFGSKLERRFLKLSPRETKICHLIKRGLSSKDIASLLSISTQTVVKHRFNIRKKLGISGERANLTTTLKSII